MNKLYQSSNEYKYNLNSQRPLRNSNYVAASVEVMDNPWDTSSNSKPAVVQTSYVSQSHIHTNSNNNQNQDSSQPNVYMYNLPAQETNNNALNPSLTLITNNAQSNANAFKNTILKPEYTNQFNTFVNAKYHPNPDHFGEATKEVLPSKPSVTNNAYAQATSNQKIIFNMHKNPFNQNKEVGQTLQYTPQNDQMSNLNAIKTNINQPPFILNNRLNNNPNYLTNPNTWNQPQTKALPPYIYNLLYPNKFNPTASALRPNNAIYNQFYPQGVNTQNSINNMPFGQRIINGFPRPQTDQGVAVNRPSLPYTGYFNNNGPFTQKLNYYNDEMVIDKLANWISGTNPVKLNSNIDTEEAEIELTYRVNKPPPLYQPAVFYVKFRMPYNQFAQHLADFLRIKENSRSLSTNSDLYNDLAAQYNATVIQTDMADAPEDIKSPEGKFLVRARYIQPNESGNANPNSVDIINLDKEAEPNKENVQGRARNVESNNDRMQLEDV
ncbi:putative uncharacterized protein DDB_G0282133 isoform X1 [Leguminivora glycinivorella]|uniref:putative uncharacterized protein DDB_G0282133 isoform X1 n=1 Tax=Leguminivora glycinivorella TaxID=1035111 RepID=UPI0020100BD0|nr:putative uncharacterized protein DDB_G0282133 isoform X1 [Leguminivora glycinivorella]